MKKHKFDDPCFSQSVSGLDDNKNGCHKETTEPSSFFGTRSKQQLPGDRELEQQLWDSLRFLHFRPSLYLCGPACTMKVSQPW